MKLQKLNVSEKVFWIFSKLFDPKTGFFDPKTGNCFLTFFQTFFAKFLRARKNKKIKKNVFGTHLFLLFKCKKSIWCLFLTLQHQQQGWSPIANLYASFDLSKDFLVFFTFPIIISYTSKFELSIFAAYAW